MIRLFIINAETNQFKSNRSVLVFITKKKKKLDFVLNFGFEEEVRLKCIHIHLQKFLILDGNVYNELKLKKRII